VRDPAVDEDEIDRPIANYLISNMEITALGILGFGDHNGTRFRHRKADDRSVKRVPNEGSVTCKSGDFEPILPRFLAQCQKGSKCPDSRARPRRNGLLRFSVSAIQKL
jgi:hypothetical protein